MLTSTPWYTHPLLWIGLGAAGVGAYQWYRRRHPSFGALPDQDFPTGSSNIPSSLIRKRLGKTAPAVAKELPELAKREPLKPPEPRVKVVIKKGPPTPPPKPSRAAEKVVREEPAPVEPPTPEEPSDTIAPDESGEFVRRMSPATRKLYQRVMDLSQEFRQGRGNPKDADVFCPAHPHMCDGVCYRSGFSTGFCTEDNRCICAGWRGTHPESEAKPL